MTGAVESRSSRERGVLGGWPWPTSVVWGCGLVSVALYFIAFTTRFSLVRYGGTPLLDLGKIGGYGPLAGVYFVAPLVALWVCYLLACGAATRARSGLLPVTLLVALLCCGVLLFLYPITAADIFNYLLYGLEQHQGFNPLVTAPAEAGLPDLLRYSAWPAYPSPYGPLWQLLSYLLTGLTGPRLLAGLLAFKGLLIGCHLLNVWLVHQLARELDADRPDAVALAYGWHPLLLYETAGNGHNDILMLTLLLLALWLFTRWGAERVGALPLVVAATLAKYVAALWLPALAFAIWRRERARRAVWVLAGAALLSLFVVADLLWPYWAGSATFAGVRRQSDLYTTSFGGLALIALTEQRHAVPPRALLDALKLVTLLVVGATIVARLPRRATLDAVVRALFDVTLVYLLIGALWFQPWYLVPLVGLGVLASPARRLVATAFALGATGSYVVYFYVWPALGWSANRLLIQGLAVGIAFGPVVVALAALATPWGWRRYAGPRSRR